MLHSIPGDFFRQTSRKTVFVNRAVIPCQIDDVKRGLVGQELVILAVNIIRVGDMIPPGYFTVFVAGGFHCATGLLFGRTAEREPGTVRKGGNHAPGIKSLHFVHRNTSISLMTV
nr:MAG TPA: hypothetical protein [Caudoviricetes sp.]